MADQDGEVHYWKVASSNLVQVHMFDALTNKYRVEYTRHNLRFDFYTKTLHLIIFAKRKSPTFRVCFDEVVSYWLSRFQEEGLEDLFIERTI